MNTATVGCVYIHTNILSGKSYIGQTVNTPSERWRQHVKDALSRNSSLHFHRAIKKYGKDTWVMKVLEKDIEYPQLNAREMYWISKFDTCRNGYNLTGGCAVGGHYNPHRPPMSAEQKQKLREANLGKKASDATKAQMRKSHLGVRASSFKPWWYMTPTGEHIDVYDMTKKELCILLGWGPKSISECSHGNMITQGPKQSWMFGNGHLLGPVA